MDISTLNGILGAILVLAGLLMTLLAYFDARTKGEPTELRNLLAIPGDVAKVLPDLVKTRAGTGVAVMLLGIVLLLGTTVSQK